MYLSPKLKEATDILFINPLKKYLEENIELVRDYLRTKTKSLKITSHDIELSDLEEKIKNRDHLNDKQLTINEDGIEVLLPINSFFKQIKDDIPRTIEELTIPGELIDFDFTFLEQFPNLKKLNLSDATGLDAKDLEYLQSHTTVREITSSAPYPFGEDIKKSQHAVTITSPIAACQYKDIYFRSSYYDEKDQYQKRLEATLPSYKEDLPKLKALYERTKPYIKGPIRSIAIEDLKTNRDDYHTVRLDLEEDELELVIDSDNVDEVLEIVKSFEQDLSIPKVRLKFPNISSEHLYYLSHVSRNHELTIDYGSPTKTNYEEYANMRATIDYYKDLVKENNLSPLEQIALIYDILKTYPYQENHEEKSRSRTIPAIVTDGKIVCVGYSEFFKQLLNEFGIKAENVSVSVPVENGTEGHARNIVRVDDDKYNVHGLYFFDSTWDSVKKNLSIIEDDDKLKVTTATEKKKVVKKLDALTLYRYFLVPPSEYEQRFPGETIPSLLTSTKNNTLKEQYEYVKRKRNGEFPSTEGIDFGAVTSINNLFAADESLKTISYYMNSKRPSLETFTEIIKTVRQAEGYEKDAAIKDTDTLVEVHKMLQEQNGSSELFFQNETVKKVK